MLEPILDRLVVLPEPQKKETESGLLLPDSKKERPQKGTVINVGPGRDGIPMNCKKGDEILFSKYAGIEVSDGTEDYLIIREADIFAIIRH